MSTATATKTAPKSADTRDIEQRTGDALLAAHSMMQVATSRVSDLHGRDAAMALRHVSQALQLASSGAWELAFDAFVKAAEAGGYVAPSVDREREACALLCDTEERRHHAAMVDAGEDHAAASRHRTRADVARCCAAAIRARGL